MGNRIDLLEERVARLARLMDNPYVANKTEPGWKKEWPVRPIVDLNYSVKQEDISDTTTHCPDCGATLKLAFIRHNI